MRGSRIVSCVKNQECDATNGRNGRRIWFTFWLGSPRDLTKRTTSPCDETKHGRNETRNSKPDICSYVERNVLRKGHFNGAARKCRYQNPPRYPPPWPVIYYIQLRSCYRRLRPTHHSEGRGSDRGPQMTTCNSQCIPTNIPHATHCWLWCEANRRCTSR